MVKADGLAAGKGVSVADQKQVIKTTLEFFKGKFNHQKEVLEEFLKGERQAILLLLIIIVLNFLGLHKITNGFMIMIKDYWRHGRLFTSANYN